MRRLLIGLAFGIAAVFSNGAIAQQEGTFVIPKFSSKKVANLPI
jgi:hypothetical protein